jgi:hypothetical protein
VKRYIKTAQLTSITPVYFGIEERPVPFRGTWRYCHSRQRFKSRLVD